MGLAAWLLSDDEPITDRVTVAVWHEVGYDVADGTTTRNYHTTPIDAVRPTRGATDIEVVCRECAEAVPVRVVDLATARRWRLRGNVLGWGDVVIFLALVLLLGTGAAALGLLPISGAWTPLAILAWLVVFFSLMVGVCWVQHWALDREDGVVLVRPGTRHTIGAARSAVVTVREHHDTTGV